MQTRRRSGLFIGADIHDKDVYVSLETDAPHIALSMTTGMGKSTFCRGIAAQILHKGGRVVIIDSVKAGDSHGGWCRNDDGTLIPGVELYRTHETAHNALVAWAKERYRRSHVAYQRDGEELQRTLVILEEMNATIGSLRNYWSGIRGSSDPLRSPAVDAMLDLTCAGRSAKIHTLAVAQKLTAQAAGSDAVRENLGIKILAGCSERTWKMLLPEHKFPKRGMSSEAGRAWLCIGTMLKELKLAGCTDDEARTWATDGDPQPAGGGLVLPAEVPAPRAVPADPPCDVRRADDRVGPGQQGQEAARPSLPDVPPEAVTLSQAVSLGLLPGRSLDDLKNDRKRDERFPAPVGMAARGAHLFSWVELMSWYESRQK